jgi:hypothetical protein
MPSGLLRDSESSGRDKWDPKACHVKKAPLPTDKHRGKDVLRKKKGGWGRTCIEQVIIRNFGLLDLITFVQPSIRRVSRQSSESLGQALDLGQSSIDLDVVLGDLGHVCADEQRLCSRETSRCRRSAGERCGRKR